MAPTPSTYSVQLPPPPPVLLSLSATDLVPPSFPPLLSHIDLKRRVCEPTPVSSRRPAKSEPLARERSAVSPLTDLDEDWDHISSRCTPVGSSSNLIRVPKNAKIEMAELDEKTLEEIKRKVNCIAAERLDTTKSWSSQDGRILKKIFSELALDFPVLTLYDNNWPLKLIIMGHLKYTTAQASRNKANRIVSTLAAASPSRK
ncbi:hypothetical protein C8R44DRAFT_736925 [Mycena epipterygia]|nr:hypothetical protein C8R44DRAFT_736925 [Mycena epipterygia]